MKVPCKRPVPFFLPSQDVETTTETKEIIDFLKNPATYSHRPDSIDIVQTHASVVALAPPFAYKVKKQVNFGFLDYSSLHKRELNIRRELELNQELAPDIYLDAVPICRSGNQLSLNSGGAIVDFALKMRWYDERNLLSARLERSEVNGTDIDRLCSLLAEYYSQKRGDAVRNSHGSPEDIWSSVQANLDVAERFTDLTIAQSELSVLIHYSKSAFQSLHPLMRQRFETGWIVPCHGDLHCQHVLLENETIRILDCIEFNDRYREIDPLSDIAFLIMDLKKRGRPDLAGRVIRNMLGALGGSEVSELLRFYIVYRACVRGKVHSLASGQVELSAADREKQRNLARDYWLLACREALQLDGGLIIAVMGKVGTGKSVVSRMISDFLGVPRYSTDELRKELFGLENERLNVGQSELYGDENKNRVYATLLERTLQSGPANTIIVIDATFSKREQRDQLRAICHRFGRELLFLWVTCSSQEQEKRLRERVNDFSDAKVSDMEALNAQFEEPDSQETDVREVRADMDIAQVLPNALNGVWGR